MTTVAAERLVRAIDAEVTRRDVADLAGGDDLVSAAGIDSMQGLQILAAVEKRFDVRLADDELIDLRTIDRIVAAARRAAAAEALP
jgi:acyl carrier protein